MLSPSGDILNCHENRVTYSYFFLSAGDIKSILETELQVPVSKMQLKGWKGGDVSDSVRMTL